MSIPSSRLRLPALLAVCLALLLPAAGAGQEPRNFSAALLLGAGGSPDSEDSEYGNGSYQLGFSFLTDIKTRLWVRYGEIDFGGEGFDRIAQDGELTYLTVAGEYRFPETYYESGLFAGLGFYDLAGRDLFGVARGGSGIGANLGVTGDFRITDRFSVLAELAGHFADLEEASVFVTGHVGVAFNF